MAWSEAASVADLALLVLGCALATYLWRGLGLLVSGRVRVNSGFFVWAGCVAYALIAGLAVRIVLMPTGTLAATPLPERLLACLIALAFYFVFRRNLLVGIAAGFVALVALIAAR
jgi:branched-subunit amino acid transport protein